MITSNHAYMVHYYVRVACNSGLEIVFIEILYPGNYILGVTFLC